MAVFTACIPPLCPAGFGLALLNFDFFFGGMYCYLINCVFIGIGTWILSIVLGYQKYYLEKGELKAKIFDGLWEDAGTFDSLLRVSNEVARDAQLTGVGNMIKSI